MDEDRLRYSLVIGYINNTSIIVNGRNTEETIKTLLILYKKVKLWVQKHALVFVL